MGRVNTDTLGKRLDIKYLKAKKMTGRYGMYHRIHLLEKRSGYKWNTLSGPVWVGDYILMVLVRPRNDDAKYNDVVYSGECTNGWEKE